MIRKTPDGKYLPYYFDLEAKGKARKRAARPKRDALSIHNALKKLNLRYCAEVSFFNPLHVGKHGDLAGGLQWVEFVIRKGKRPFVVILDDPHKRYHEYEKEYLLNKQAGLTVRNVPFVILPAGKTSQDYQMRIWIFMKKKGVL